jgi:stage III sporulation protein AG
MKILNLDKDKLTELFKNPKFVRISLIVGVLLIILIAFSECMSNVFSNTPRKQTQPLTEQFSEADLYAQSIEEKLIEILSHIEGVGKVEVLVTAGTTEEYVYAKEGKTGSNSSTDEIVIIDSGNGKQALTEKIIKPAITGVVIVCEGGDDSRVCERVYNAVRAALGIGASKIYVTERQ